MAKPRVLLTNPIHPDEQARLAGHVDVVVAPDVRHETLIGLAAECDGMIVRSHLPSNIFDTSPRMRFVVRHGVGLDMVPVHNATARRIAVANLPGSNTQAVCEYVLNAMMTLRRNLVAIDTVLRDRGWAVAKPMSNSSVELGDSVLGVVGYGSIGRRLAQIGHALGMRVLTHTRRPEVVVEPVRAVELAELLSEADVIVLACPHNEQTHHLLNAHALSKLKPTAVLINVARGPVVDNAALVQALQKGWLAGAALDVHEPAILTGQEDIFNCRNVILTPHLAGITATSLDKMSRWAVDTLLELFAGGRPANVVNPEVFV